MHNQKEKSEDFESDYDNFKKAVHKENYNKKNKITRDFPINKDACQKYSRPRKRTPLRMTTELAS